MSLYWPSEKEGWLTAAYILDAFLTHYSVQIALPCHLPPTYPSSALTLCLLCHHHNAILFPLHYVTSLIHNPCNSVFSTYSARISNNFLESFPLCSWVMTWPDTPPLILLLLLLVMLSSFKRSIAGGTIPIPQKCRPPLPILTSVPTHLEFYLPCYA